MEDLLSKEHYCYKIHTLLMESGAYPLPSIDTPPYMDYPPHFHSKILINPPMIFQKSKPPINKGGWSHYDNTNKSLNFCKLLNIFNIRRSQLRIQSKLHERLL